MQAKTQLSACRLRNDWGWGKNKVGCNGNDKKSISPHQRHRN
jgi:hypothetical protein